MPDESHSDPERGTDTDDTEIIEASQQYTLGDCVRVVGEGLQLFEEVGDISFEYMLVGANLDGGSTLITFGLRKYELLIRKGRE